MGAGTFAAPCSTLVQHSSAAPGPIVWPAQTHAWEGPLAVLPDPYFALPSLYGAPAYTRPPRPAAEPQRPLDPDDLPLATQQTEEERRVAAALMASGGYTPGRAGDARGLAAGGDAGYRMSDSGPVSGEPEVGPRRPVLRGLTERIRPHR